MLSHEVETISSSLTQGRTPFPFKNFRSRHLRLRRTELVVELFSIRDLAADYPMSFIFKLSRLDLFHSCVVVKDL